MEIQFTNTLSGKLEKFKPLHKDKVGLYVCGLTPYDSTHLGHGRCYVLFDVIRRTFEAAGYKILHVQNFTDVDDRILERSSKLGVSPIYFADQFIGEYFEAMNALNVLKAHHYPRVTQFIPKIIQAVEKLVERGYAYATSEGDVYYQTSRFKDYGKLSKKKMDELMAGARVEVSPHKKEPGDFALWKADSKSQLTWKSPWSKGRPGWHIECSVMSYAHLGQPFDIHGGGEDLIFPHHENEIAQSEGLHGKPFARYFIHNGFVTINQEKMSKSLGNFFTLKDLLKHYEACVLRYYLLSEYYRRPLDFSDIALDEASRALARLKEAYSILFFVGHRGPKKDLRKKQGALSKKLLSALSNDFHTPSALAYFQDWASRVFEGFKNKTLTPANAFKLLEDAIWASENLLGITFPSHAPEVPADAKNLIKEREKARKNKEFLRGDGIRKKLQEVFGLAVEDTPYGPMPKSINPAKPKEAGII